MVISLACRRLQVAISRKLMRMPSMATYTTKTPPQQRIRKGSAKSKLGFQQLFRPPELLRHAPAYRHRSVLGLEQAKREWPPKLVDAYPYEASRVTITEL